MTRETMPVCATAVLFAVLLVFPAQAQAQTGCTLTQGFWKNHSEAWPVTMWTLGGSPYTREQLITLLATPPRGDATYILAKQLIAAQLNVLSGASSSGVAALINSAEGWLISVGLGSWPTGTTREMGVQLAKQLDDFNNGLSGVPACQEGVVPPPPDGQD